MTQHDPADLPITDIPIADDASGGPPAPPGALPARADGTGDDPDALTLARYAERAYLDYAISTVKGRALPDVCDGQKPVQRRILYAMNEMGLGPGAKPVKSARVVGDVLGKFHPHGDTAAYDALVRMAQPFSLRYPLIDGQGNFGSRDGDGAAAMRYTEARLTPLARLLLDEIDEGTVDFVPNYDGSFEEPAVLPARLPVVLLNGASGIAVAMATEIPSHNLREVARAAVLLARRSKATLEDVLDVLPGPDFPGGGQIISSPQDIAEAYRSGRGTLKVRAIHHVEDLARGQWQLVIDRLPPGVSTQRVLEEIEELTNPKLRAGKKALSAEQVQMKQQMLGLLDAVRDESGKEADVRIVLEPRTAKIDRQVFVNTLLAHTSLESGTSLNLVMVGRDGRPRQKSLLQILSEWVGFRLHTLERRSRHRLAKVDDRIHILEGRQTVLLNVDEVIRIIRESDEPGPALRQAFGLSQRQADDILEIRLRQLARLEAIRIDRELAELRAERGALQRLLGSDSEMRRLLVREIEADAKQYGDDRRTVIEAAERASAEVAVVDEPVTVVVSERGWVRAHKGHGIDTAALSFKSGDAFYGAYPVQTTDLLYAVATDGRVYAVPVTLLPSGRGDGVPLTSLVDLEPGARIEHAFSCGPDTGVLVATRHGMGLLCQARDWHSTRLRAGKGFVTLADGDAPLRPALFTERDAVHVVCLSDGDRPRLLEFALTEMKVLKNGGRGVILMGLEPGEMLKQALVCGLDGIVVAGTGRGERAMSRVVGEHELVSTYSGARARKGRALEPRWKLPRIAAA